MSADATLTVKLGGVAGAHAASVSVLSRHARPGWVVVHGGGGEVSAWSRRLQLTPRTHEGLRVTDPETLEVAVAVLRGLVNARLVAGLAAAGVSAVGLCGADAGLLTVRRADPALGAVGHVIGVGTALLDALADQGQVPVVAPIAADGSGDLVNVNADEVAGAIAAARGGRLLLLTDVPGVERDGRLQPELDRTSVEEMLDDGSADGGMRPKLRAALTAATAGAEVRIVDGRDAAAVEAALSGAAVGTRVIADAIPEAGAGGGS